MKKVLGMLLAVALILSMSVTAMAADNEAKIGDTEYATLQAALEAVQDNSTVTLLKDLDLSTWTSKQVNHSFTLDGNGKTVTGLKQPLFSIVNYSGGKVLTVTIQNLTVNNSAIEAVNDANGATAALIGWVSEYATVTINNCAVKNTTVTTGTSGSYDYGSALVAYVAGGSSLAVTGCTVENVTVTANNSCGLLTGHFAGTTLNVASTKATGTNTVNCVETESDGSGRPDKVGVLVGRVNTGTATLTNGEVTGTTTVSPAGDNPKRIIGDLVDATVPPTATVSGGKYPEGSLVTNNKGGNDTISTNSSNAPELYDPTPAPTTRPSGGSSRPSGHLVTSPFTGVDAVYVDGALVAAANYTVSGGDVVLSESYLNTLKAGTHNIKIVFGDRQATGTFETKGGASIESAKTFDPGVALYVGMALSSALGAAYVSKKK